jgi:hypothetical protein
LCIDTVKPPHASNQVGLWSLHHQMVMVVHQAIGITTPSLLLHLLPKEIEEILPISVI